MRGGLALLLLGAVASGSATAQTPPYAIYRDTVPPAGAPADSFDEGSEPPVMRECAKPSDPVGPILGHGWVTYTVTTKGRIDPSTLEVVEAEGISPAGLLSAARRLLANCRYRAARQAGTTIPVTVRHHVEFSTGNFAGSVEEVMDGIGVPEEMPSVIRCSDTRARPFRGTLQLSFIIGRDGKVEPDGIEVAEASTARLRRAAHSIAVSCRYTPARILGETVRVRVSQRFNFGRARR